MHSITKVSAASKSSSGTSASCCHLADCFLLMPRSRSVSAVPFGDRGSSLPRFKTPFALSIVLSSAPAFRSARSDARHHEGSRVHGPPLWKQSVASKDQPNEDAGDVSVSVYVGMDSVSAKASRLASLTASTTASSPSCSPARQARDVGAVEVVGRKRSHTRSGSNRSLPLPRYGAILSTSCPSPQCPRKPRSVWRLCARPARSE